MYMKKILVMGFTKIKFMPYMNFYLDNINQEKNEVHILYWNRDLKEEDTMHVKNLFLHEFKCYQEDDVSKIYKVKSFFKYREYAKQILETIDFDFVFVLHSLPAILVADILIKKYANKYILDYRDSTYENIKIFKMILGKIVENSKATFVSSDAFRDFLPKSEIKKIFTSHNILLDSLNHREEKEIYGIPSEKIRIAFWGFIRQGELNRKIIDRISNDNRFELHYYGREQQVALSLKQYVMEQNINNVFFHGEYQPKDRYQFVKTTDLIHNIYFDSNTMLAMGNKYYDGIIFRIPQLCMKNSFMGRSVSKNGIGFECDPDDENFVDNIFNYYLSINKNIFKQNVDKSFNKIIEEYYAGSSFIKSVVEELNK